MTDQPIATGTAQEGIKQSVSNTHQKRRQDGSCKAELSWNQACATPLKKKNPILHSAGGIMIVVLTLQ